MLLHTLGGLYLSSSLAQPKPLMLLAYLALEGPQDRRHLAELFWPGATDPLNRLAVTLARLRRAEPTCVSANNLKVWTTLPTDVRVLLDAVEEGRHQEVISLYQGRFLEGVYFDGGTLELEEWVYATREKIAARVRFAQLRVAESVAAQANFLEASQLAERAYLLPGAAEPEVDELAVVYRLLMAGSSHLAKEVREEAQTFGRDFSLTPEEARQQLINTPSMPPHNLTPQPTPFVGRSAEMTALHEKLRDPHCRLLTIVGPGGVGKTRLAIEVAQGQVNAFKDGVYFVSLVPVTSPAAIAYAVSTVLDFTLQGQDTPQVQLARYLENKTMLLVLDNLEHLLADLSLIQALLVHAPSVKLLTTSRERLNLQAEHVFDLYGLAVPAQAVNAEAHDAVKLFVQSARQRQPTFTLDDTHTLAVSRICQLLGGLPLALELSANWIRVLEPDEIVREIERGIDFLSVTTRDVPERHRSIRAVFDYSWQLLSEQEQGVLRKLAVFRGGFRCEAAFAVAGASLSILAGLIDRSLLTTAPGGRYRRHPLVIQYTQERLAENFTEKARAEEAHGIYYLRLFGARVPELKSLDRKVLLTALEADLPNFNAAWHWAVEHKRIDEIKLGVQAIGEVHHHQEAAELLTVAAEHLRDVDPNEQRALGYVLIELGFRCAFLGLQEKALDAAERGLSLVRSLGDNEGTLNGLYTLATCQFFAGDFRQNKQLAEEGLALARRLRHAGHTSIFLAQLAGVIKEIDGLPNVEQFLEEGLAEARQLHGYPEYFAAYLQHYATYLLHNGDLSRAQELEQESQSLFVHLGLERWQSGCLDTLGILSLKLGDVDKAEKLFWEALALAEKMSQRFMQARILSNLAKVATVREDYTRAEQHLKRSLQIGYEIENPHTLGETIVSIAKLRITQSEPLKAATWLALIAQHPKVEKHLRKDAKTVLTDLRDRLPVEEFEVAIEQAKSVTLKELAWELSLNLKAT